MKLCDFEFFAKLDKQIQTLKKYKINFLIQIIINPDL